MGHFRKRIVKWGKGGNDTLMKRRSKIKENENDWKKGII
jgi:hypothetical protein